MNPAPGSPPTSPGPAAAPPHIRPDPHVLVVEDEPRLRELLLRALAGWGFDAQAVRSGEEALRSADARPPEVVVLDLNLPGIDGLDLLRRLRERWPRVQAIVLTGFGSIDAAKQAIHLDVVEFLTKPCRLAELEQALDRAMRRLGPPDPPVVVIPDAERGDGGDSDDADDADDAGGAPPANGTARRTLEEVERDHILRTLARNGGNRTATAVELGISRRTLYYKLSEYQKQGHDVG